MYDKFVNFFFGLGLVINAMLYVPQFFRIIKTKHARDASLITFAGFNIINLLTFLHGIIEHDMILIFGSGLSTVTNTCVTIAIVWYRFIKINNQI